LVFIQEINQSLQGSPPAALIFSPLKTHKMIKTKKLASGYYTGTYNGINFRISKVELMRNKVAWYWQIGNSMVDDYYSCKSLAIQAVKLFIEEIK